MTSNYSLDFSKTFLSIPEVYNNTSTSTSKLAYIAAQSHIQANILKAYKHNSPAPLAKDFISLYSHHSGIKKSPNQKDLTSFLEHFDHNFSHQYNLGDFSSSQFDKLSSVATAYFLIPDYFTSRLKKIFCCYIISCVQQIVSNKFNTHYKNLSKSASNPQNNSNNTNDYFRHRVSASQFRKRLQQKK